MRVGDFFRRLFTRREKAKSEKKLTERKDVLDVEIQDLQAKIEAVEKRRQQIERDYQASRRARRAITQELRVHSIRERNLERVSRQRPTKASHQDVSKFFKGKGGRILPSYRRAIKQRLQPEEE